MAKKQKEKPKKDVESTDHMEKNTDKKTSGKNVKSGTSKEKKKIADKESKKDESVDGKEAGKSNKKEDVQKSEKKTGEKADKSETRTKEKKDEVDEPRPKPKKNKASARIENARISFKDSKIICRKIKNWKLSKAKDFLQDLLDEKKNIDGKYHTKAAEKILELLTNVEANSFYNGLDNERLFIYSIKSDKGRTFYRPRSKNNRRGERAKMTHLEVIVGEK